LIKARPFLKATINSGDERRDLSGNDVNEDGETRSMIE
jgi:hypothetical protein